MDIEPKIDKKTLAFIIPVIDSNSDYWTFYIPLPSKERVNSIVPILGSLFSLRESSKLSSIVLARDYEIYAREACKNLAAENKEAKSIDSETDILFKTLSDFVEASFLAGHAISPNFKAIPITEIGNKIPEDSLDMATGMYLFFCAIFRYAWMILSPIEKKDMSTSSTLTEYVKSMQTPPSAAEASVAKAIA